MTNKLSTTNNDTITQEMKDKVYEVRFATSLIIILYHYPMKTNLIYLLINLLL